MKESLLANYVAEVLKEMSTYHTHSNLDDTSKRNLFKQASVNIAQARDACRRITVGRLDVQDEHVWASMMRIQQDESARAEVHEVGPIKLGNTTEKAAMQINFADIHDPFARFKREAHGLTKSDNASGGSHPIPVR